MKSERKHELQTNSLALWLRWRAPVLWEQYGNRILLGLIVLILLVWFIRWRINAPKEAAARANMALAQAENLIDGLRQFNTTPDRATEVPKLIQNATQESDAPEIQGRAYQLLGDYNWTLYNFPDLSAASTQPSTKTEPKQLLDRAADAYRKVLSTADVPPYLAGAARLGLGVVEETRAFNEDRKAGPEHAGKSTHWAAAREQYEAVAKSETFSPQLRQEASWHLGALERLQSPVWLVDAPPATQPTTLPLGPLGPEIPAAPSTRPATTRPAK